MGTLRVGLILVLSLAFAALFCAASAPTTFFPSEEGGGMGKARMLRGRGRSSKASRIHLDDYDTPSANHGHDPGRGFGGDGGRRRPEKP